MFSVSHSSKNTNALIRILTLSPYVCTSCPCPSQRTQELFLRSSMPKAALEMRKDLKHWAEALKLAEQLDPDNIAYICKEHAAMEEMTGEYSSAKAHYQQVGLIGTALMFVIV